MKTYTRIMIWSVSTMILTLVHHIYGAIVYESSFRLHVAVFAIPVIIVILAGYIGFVKIRNAGWRKVCLTIFLGSSLLFSVAAIGLYEGGYNHVLKDVLYFGGVSIGTLNQMYPSIYQLPDNLVFELTGVAQFFTGIIPLFNILHLRVLHKSHSLKQIN